MAAHARATVAFVENRARHARHPMRKRRHDPVPAPLRRLLQHDRVPDSVRASALHALYARATDSDLLPLETDFAELGSRNRTLTFSDDRCRVTVTLTEDRQSTQLTANALPGPVHAAYVRTTTTLIPLAVNDIGNAHGAIASSPISVLIELDRPFGRRSAHTDWFAI